MSWKYRSSFVIHLLRNALAAIVNSTILRNSFRSPKTSGDATEKIMRVEYNHPNTKTQVVKIVGVSALETISD